MHAPTTVSTSLLALTTFLSFTLATPVVQSQTPYLAVRNFTFSKSSTSSRYTLSLSFPQDVVIAPGSGGDPTFTIPGFTEPVACTGTYFYAPSETSTVTSINACGFIGDGKTQTVTSKLDVELGALYLTYSYNATAGGREEVFGWNATQTGLVPVTREAMESFNTPAFGPGVDQQ